MFALALVGVMMTGAVAPSRAAAPAARSGIGCIRTTVRGAPVRAALINMRDRRVRVGIALPADGLGHAESFDRFLARTLPVAAVTGTYFDGRTLQPVGDLVINGRFVYRGCVGTALTVGRDNRVHIRPRARGGKYPGCETVLASGPRLVIAGRAAVTPGPEGFRDPGLFRATYRVAAGVTRAGKLLLVNVAAPVSLWELARIMAALGAMEAINLDGGTSAAFYFRGQVRARPGRVLTNLVVAYETAADYGRATAALAPRPRTPAGPGARPVVAAALLPRRSRVVPPVAPNRRPNT
jgi:hypothetical protein